MRIFLGVLVFLSVWAQAATVTGISEDTTLVSAVYHRPRQGAEIIGCIPDGTVLAVKGYQNGYYQIDCCGMTGYLPISQVAFTDKYRVSCAENSPDTRLLTCLDHDSLTRFREQILRIAKNQLGSYYVYGAAQPGAFDCSGLTYYLYGRMHISLHRCADEQLQDGVIVPKEDMQLGDLVYFREAWASCLATHIGIYIGDNRIIHAGSNGVCISDLRDTYFEKNYLASRRIVLEDSRKDVLSPPTGPHFYSGLRPEEIPVPSVIFQEKGKPLIEFTFSLLPQAEASPLLSYPYFLAPLGCAP